MTAVPLTWSVAAAVIASGGLAAVARYLVSVVFSSDTRFPWAVLVVNAVGCTIGGIVLGLGTGLPAELHLVLLTGVVGGLTTFSTFSVETVQLVLDGRGRVAALNVAANLVVGLAVTALAYRLVLLVVG